jgi:hypothetical protein
MRIVLACLLGGLLGHPTNATAAFVAVGAGLDSCATWTADRQVPAAGPALQDEQWVVGFLTGIADGGLIDADPMRGVDAQAVWAWIDNYCRANPLDKILRAAEAFYQAHPH